MLAEAGLTDGDGNGVLEHDGTDVSFTLLVPEGQFPADVQVAEITANALKAVGIDVQIRKIEKSSFWDTLRLPVAETGWELAMFGFNPSNASGLYHLDSMHTSNPDNADRPAVWNVSRYSNAEVDALLQEAKGHGRRGGPGRHPGRRAGDHLPRSALSLAAGQQHHLGGLGQRPGRRGLAGDLHHRPRRALLTAASGRGRVSAKPRPCPPFPARTGS